jgi:hypothetical protein
LKKAVENGGIILLDGLRRIGKTSLLKAFLNESDDFNIFVDCRMLYKNKTIKPSELNNVIFDSINREIKKNKFKKIIGKISSVNFGGFGISLNKNNNEKNDNIGMTLRKINDLLKNKNKKFIIAFDEAQYLRYYNRGGNEFLQLMAYAYDNLENILFILTGSEVGLLHDFLSVDDIDAPLYGRYLNEITLKRFEREQSIKFLKTGFEDEKMEIPEKIIEKAVNELDGIVGYLSMFGYIMIEEENTDFDSSLNKTTEMAKAIVKKEINSLINLSVNYAYVLNAIGFGMKRYSKIKKYIEMNFNGITDTTLSKILSSLVKQNFIETKYEKAIKKYIIPDPIILNICQNLKLT